jgi:putative spermidine/putrescine transport system substrate-binding protein
MCTSSTVPTAATARSAATPVASASAAAGAAIPTSTGAVTLTFYSGGDVNVQDLWQNTLLPAYKKAAPNVGIDFVFSEHGTSDQATFDRIAAAKQAGKPAGVDLWEVGSSTLQRGGQAGLMERVGSAGVPNLAQVSQDAIDQVSGYGVPYRGSSVVLGYNSKQISDPPKTLDALIAWVKKNPGQFTYCPPDTGGSGGAFVTRVVETDIPPGDIKLFQSGYDQSKESEWDKGWGILKDIHGSTFNNGQYPKGNVPVMQAMANGGVAMAPVWSDLALSYLQQNLLPPEVKLVQIDPPFYGGASDIGVLADSQKKGDAFAFLNWLLTPEAQQLVIEKMNGYPGIEWRYMPPAVQQKFADIAKAYSIGFSSQFGSDMNKQWYEKVAGMPAPKS